MLYRNIESKIAEWIGSTGREALLLTGARQIGKTYLIRELLKKSGRDFVEFNLIEQPSLIPLFESARANDTGSFLSRLSVATKHKLVKGKTIIFF
ncbi:MAG: AAA family ATPase, partial [Treponema sp.]|nr:AAA family ATPase [Treponema sp.]